MFLALLNNAALLLAMVVVFEQVLGRRRALGVVPRLAAGVAIGGVAVGVMAFPVPFVGGVVFDARSVLLGLVGAFFHPLVGAVAAVLAGAYRYFVMGGLGAVAGTAVAVTSVLLGYAARRSWRDRLDQVPWLELYAFGWVLQLATLGWIATIPEGAGPAAVRAIALPSLAILPAATAALGWMLARRLRQERLAEAVRASEERLRRAIDASPVPMLLVDDRGVLAYVGASWFAASGYRAGQLRTMADWLRLAFDADDATVADALRQAFDGPHDGPVDRRVRLADGSEAVWSFATAALDPGREGARLAVVAATDVTERRALERERRRAALVFDAAGEAMLLTDGRNRILKANRAVLAVTGYDPEELVGQHALAFRSSHRPPPDIDAIEATLAAHGRWDGEVWNVRADGTEFLAEVSITAAPDADDAEPFRVIVFADVTDRKQAEERIWRQANFDALTGLPNRRLFHERLRQELERATRDGHSVAVLLLDLDRFKEVNDTLGHTEGDALLVQLAQRIRAHVRSSDVVARMGGDEFALVLPDADDRHGVERVVEGLLRAIAEPIPLAEDVAYVSASVGVTVFPHDGRDIADLLKNADQALYAAKDDGRDRWAYFAPAMEQALQAKRSLGRDLRAALEVRALDLAYQPIVELATGRVRSVEALLRWTHPTRGAVPPSTFVPLAEESGLMVPLGAWVLDTALAQVARWRAAGHVDLRVSVNVSPVQFVAEAIAWRDRLEAHGLPGDALVVEITEGLLLDERPQVAAQLLELRALGVAVALDDFGTGYSSLAYLKRLDIDYLKVDRAFVRDLGRNPDDLALNEAVVVMAHRLGLRVVAEGIETEEQARLLREAGCDLAQGYWFARPLPAADVERLLDGALPRPADRASVG